MIFIKILKCKIFEHPTFCHFLTLGLLSWWKKTDNQMLWLHLYLILLLSAITSLDWENFNLGRHEGSRNTIFTSTSPQKHHSKKPIGTHFIWWHLKKNFHYVSEVWKWHLCYLAILLCILQIKLSLAFLIWNSVNNFGG